MRITRHLSYPTVARRLKWQGMAVVTFYILENGLVENIKIASSSGHRLLDNHVIDTVKRLQPFPKPPLRAEITIPVKYILSDYKGEEYDIDL
jgi:periplasmic protein TonB